MQVVIAGATGFLGSHLAARLRELGHTVTALTRRSPQGPDQSRWRPEDGIVDTGLIGSADVVVNLAGSPTLGNPHSAKWRAALRDSRVSSTRTLAQAVAAAIDPPALLAGNASGWYGDHGDQVVTEQSDSRGDALLTSVCRDWQAAAESAVVRGARVCFLRTAPVMDGSQPPLKMQKLQFRLGLGGRLGNGRQYFPLISLRDWVGAVAFLLESDLAGPVNLCAPETPTNADFTRALADAVHRPAVLTAPEFVLTRAAGPLAPEVLGSLRLAPRALLDAGYRFADHDVRDVLAAAL